MIRVLHISKYLYPVIGGIEVVAREMSNALSSENIEQRIICFNEEATDGTHVYHRNETIHDSLDGIPTIRCGCFARIASQSLSWTYLFEMKRLIKEFNPDVVIFHYPNPFVAHILMKYRNKRFKLAIYWHFDITKQKFLKILFHRQNIRLIRRSNIIIGATPIHLNESSYSEYFNGKKELIPYAIDEKNLLLTNAEEKKARIIKERYTGKTLCLFIGRHVPYKGLKYLIESSKLLDDTVHILIAGSGELTDQLKEQAMDDQKIEFIGRIDDSEKRMYLKACDIFCFPSITRNEGFGLAMAEAMYFGKPVVTFTIPGSGVNYVNLNNVTGIECPNRNTEAYARAIAKLAHDPQLRMLYGENGRMRVLDLFSVEQFKSKTQSLIQKLG